mgnify:CR=1 FL=1
MRFCAKLCVDKTLAISNENWVFISASLKTLSQQILENADSNTVSERSHLVAEFGSSWFSFIKRVLSCAGWMWCWRWGLIAPAPLKCQQDHWSPQTSLRNHSHQVAFPNDAVTVGINDINVHGNNNLHTVT